MPDIVSIAINVPLQRIFDYEWHGEQPLHVGMRVRVPFGNSKKIGIVWSSTASPAPDMSLKPITEVLDETPLLAEPDMALLHFAATYYRHPPGEVAAAALPAVLREGRDAAIRDILWRITPAGDQALAGNLLTRARRQQALLRYLAANPEGVSRQMLERDVSGWQAAARRTQERGFSETCEREATADYASTTPAQPPLSLNSEQAHALAAVLAGDGKFGVHLLDGVTGSGKTEVYLQAILQQLAAGKQTLVLVPEIGLTPQLAQRFERRLGVRIALLHSELSDSQRARAWLAAAKGDAPVIVGTRSAVFVPLANPGLIIVDEEHDASLKQHEGFRYHARDLAVWRARRLAVPIVLGSATPSLETLFNAQQSRYQHLQLTQRAGGAQPPRMQVIDLNRFNVDAGISQPAIDTMRAHLQAGQQVLVYLNRRGFAPTVICTECATMAECHQCDARLTLHAGKQRLQCHHCGARYPVIQHCAQCQAPVKLLGNGTERVDSTLSALFPDYPLLRIDSDTTQARGSMTSALDAARDGNVRILVGTQMLAKGHHLPDVTLVVVLDADQGFFSSDFRASERLAQTIVQVAGRAGRAEKPGEVLIQSHFPTHPLLTTLLDSGYSAFAAELMSERSKTGWPPFSHIAVLHAAARDGDAALEFLSGIQRTLHAQGIRALGPAPAAMHRRQGRYRYQLLLQTRSRGALQSALAQLTALLEQQRPQRGVRWSLDVDPLSSF
ncbi:MAG: primosomal protein N' [Pseudomonadota bacterium]